MVGLIGSAEILIAAPIAFLIFRVFLRGLGVAPGVLILIPFVSLFLYPWTQVDRIRAAFWRHTQIR